jgi:hypothetical protein
MCIISSYAISGVSASQAMHNSVTREKLAAGSDFIAIVENTGDTGTSEKISIGLFYPSFTKHTASYRVIEVLYTAPGIKTDKNGIVKVVMPNYLAKLSAHKSYYKDKISGSYLYDSYRPGSTDSIKDRQFILYAKQHFVIKGFFTDEIVQVDGMLEWTAENSYDPVSDREIIMRILKSKGNK